MDWIRVQRFISGNPNEDSDRAQKADNDGADSQGCGGIEKDTTINYLFSVSGDSGQSRKAYINVNLDEDNDRAKESQPLRSGDSGRADEDLHRKNGGDGQSPKPSEAQSGQDNQNDGNPSQSPIVQAHLLANPLSVPPSKFHEIQSRAKAKKLLERRNLIARYAAHPWPFLIEQVLTEDPHDKAGMIKPFPALAYLERFVNVWLAERRFLVPKSRRMLISWTCIALHVWLLLFHEREYIYFAARKEGRDESEGSLELVKRAKFIINNLRNFRPPKTEQKRGRIICTETHSEIVAVAQGEHQMRQLTATAIFADEFAFWEHARETYTAARPTIEGTGRFTGVSSAHPGFFKDLVFDEVA